MKDQRRLLGSVTPEYRDQVAIEFLRDFRVSHLDQRKLEVVELFVVHAAHDDLRWRSNNRSAYPN
jgi:hypothetical protein